MSVFQHFTNQYSLSKTLRFELKPVGKTQKMLEEAKVFEKDQTIQKKYEATKPFFDRLHREFVKESLQNAVLTNLKEYLGVFINWKKDKKEYEKELQKREAVLRKEIVEFFTAQAKKWNQQYSGLKNDTIELLSEEGVFIYLLEKRYRGEDGTLLIDESTGNEVSIFSSWKGFIGYFGKYFETRKNFYKDDGTSTALATRIIDQNLRRFCDNILIFESIKTKVDFSEIEQNFGKKLSEVFALDFYNTCFLQEGIDFYNKMLGGETLQNGEKIKGLNELINKYRQDHKGEKLPFLKTLDKQILSEKENMFLDEITSDEELLELLTKFQQTAETKTQILKTLFLDFQRGQEKEVYISKEALNTIVHKWTGETELFEQNLFEVLKTKKLVSSSAKKSDGEYSFPAHIAFSFLKDALEKISHEKLWKDRYYKSDENKTGFLSLTTSKNIWNQFLEIFCFEFSSLFQKESIDATGKKNIIGYNIAIGEYKKILENFSLNIESKIIIKNFADSVLSIYQMAKYFSLEKDRKWNEKGLDESDFYTNPEYGYLKFYENAYEEIVQVYNKLRNYLTQKPYSEEKWKLNFENPTLANGWDKNKEPDNSAVILRNNGKYFLGLMAKGKNKIFDEKYESKFSEGLEHGKYEKVVYKFFPDQAKMFPKVCFSTKGREFFKPSEEIVQIYENAEFKKGDTFSLTSMHQLIDFYKNCLTKYDGWKCYTFSHLKKTEEYTENIGDFFRDTAEDGYQISFQDISEKYIHEKNTNGELYLFQIKNKDWNEGARGAKNLHTLYFESLFSAENIAQNFPIKLNGQAEIFYRPKTKDLKKEKIKTKRGNILEKGEKAFLKNRFTENKIFFHVPLTLNRTKGEAQQFNSTVNNFLANNSDINIIGVDRGEKHLAYYTAINQKGEILKDNFGNLVSGSLNFVGEDGQGKVIDYHQKLEEKAKMRERARKDWQEVEGIKNLKKGYISQVVRKLADLAIEHNAIIVFEDLNMRFKQIRGGIEKSVYQQLEKALIEKLSFLVQKGETDSKKAGHLLKAYQLTAPFETFQKMGKQTGIIFYTQASYTSKIDPVTGWRPHVYLKYSNAEQAKKEIGKFLKIEFVNDRFEFTYDIKEFQPNNKVYPTTTEWTVCSCVERFRWDKTLNNNKGDYKHFSNLTLDFQTLFENVGIDISGKILEQIQHLEAKGNEKFFKDFFFYFQLICQIRNTNKDEKGNENDFILSPVAPFFDSRKSKTFGNNLPTNGDENGSYNIARKGKIILDKISIFAQKNKNCEKLSWNDLFISHLEWDNEITGRC